MSNNKVPKEIKTKMDYLQAHSLRDLILRVNSHNVDNPDCPILKEDIVEIMESEGTFILLYYNKV